MTYPAGVQLNTLTFTNPTTYLGNPVTRTEITVQVSAGVVWASTGESINDVTSTVALGPGTSGAVTFPTVDQPGYTNQVGAALTMWSYAVTRKMFFGSSSRTVQKNWQPLTGQSAVDFDNLPGGDGGTPISPTAFPVTSVAGQTGVVGASSLAGAVAPYLPAPDLPGKLDTSKVGAPSGVAPLDPFSKVPDANLPTTSNAAALGLKQDKAAASMPSAQDLNLLVTTGAWNVQVNSTASGGTNYPVPLAGLFWATFRSTSDSGVQYYRVYGTGDTYTRSLYGGTWSTWRKMSTNVDQMWLNPKDYGVIGDGVANDSAALQAWLTAGGVRLANMTCRVVTGLTLAGDNRTFYTDNATIVADTADMTVLTITGNKTRVSVNIDGNSKANYGIRSTGAGGTIERCRIENIYSATTTARAIEVTTTGGVVIRNNTINNVTSVGNAVRADGNGFARAILLYGGTSAATKRSYIVDNLIDSIVGEEGDAIAVLFDDTVSSVFLTSKATVRGNQISNVSRRFIKIQGSDTRVEGNTLTHDGVVPANPSTAIDLIQSDNVTVIGNTITPNPLLNSIATNGVAGFPNKNLVIKHNVIRQDDAKAAPGIYMNYATESTISGNTIYGCTSAILMGNCVNVAVIENQHFGGSTAFKSFDANATNTGIVMRLNTNMNNARTAYVSNLGTGALTELNAMRP